MSWCGGGEIRVVPSEQRRSRAICAVTLCPGSWPPSPGLEPWAILICSSSAETRYSAVTPKRAEATCLIRSLAESPPEGVQNRAGSAPRSEEHTSELQSRGHLVCRLLLEK